MRRPHGATTAVAYFAISRNHKLIASKNPVFASAALPHSPLNTLLERHLRITKWRHLRKIDYSLRFTVHNQNNWSNLHALNVIFIRLKMIL